MITNEGILERITKAINNLSNMDCYTKNKAQMSTNAKKVHNTYDLLTDLKKEIEGGNE